MQNKHKKWNIFNLTVQYLEVYRGAVQPLAYRSWHRVNRQEESLTGGGEGLEVVELKGRQRWEMEGELRSHSLLT